MMKKQKAPEMKKHRKVCSKGDIAFNIVNYTVFFLITLACVFPFYYLFINTILPTNWCVWARFSFTPGRSTSRTMCRS